MKKMTKLLAIICALCTAVSIIVQLAISFGAPLGEFTLGGAYIIAPLTRRPLHAALAVLWLVILIAYLFYGGIIRASKGNAVFHGLVIFNTALVLYAIYANFFITTSIKETLLMGPLTIVTGVCSITLLIVRRKKVCK